MPGIRYTLCTDAKGRGVLFLKERFQQFMAGRYGNDNFNRFLLLVSLILMILSLFSRRNIFYTLALAALVYCYFRMFSRNTYKRYAENEKYLELKNRFLGVFRRERDHASQLKNYRFFKCPNCRQKVRVPRGKGKIKIHCPKCHADFIKKS